MPVLGRAFSPKKPKRGSLPCPGKDLVREYNSLSPVHILKRKDLSQQIDVLDTRIAKLKKKDARILKT